jgi:hypothetical protein
MAGSAEPPYQAFNLNPLKAGGLCDAVSITPPMAFCCFTANETDGVGVGVVVSVTRNPLPARISATREANWSERNRRSYPTTTRGVVPATGLAFQKSAVAWATRSTLAKVKSSAMTALQPSVPNLIEAIGDSLTGQ